MKGIAHFAAGVAAASCFPGAVEAGAAGNPLYFVLGGVFGLLPDTLDFKFMRFVHRHDVEIAPDPNRPDAQLIADGFAAAAAHALRARRPVRVKFNTVRMGADAWLRYELRLDTARRRVQVRFGDVVNTGGRPLRPGPGGGTAAADALLPADLQIDYVAAMTIDAFDGPVIELQPVRGGALCAVFLPWHRQGSHSLPVTLGLALAAGAAWGPRAAAVSFAGGALHILADQAGYMGSNLFWPFTRRRVPGWRLTRSMDTLPNAAAVWGAALLTYTNLARHAAAAFNPVKLAVYGLALPLLAAVLIRRRCWRPSSRRVPSSSCGRTPRAACPPARRCAHRSNRAGPGAG
jgi:membrane-bound metal-dependent hydrolase YbcI (DUF457 family)